MVQSAMVLLPECVLVVFGGIRQAVVRAGVYLRHGWQGSRWWRW